jgi:ketosteroid isomerase-like protein
MPAMRLLRLSLSLSVALCAWPVIAHAAGPEGEVLAAQERWKQAMLKKDRAAFEKVLHPELRYAHSSGLTETRAQAIEHVLGSTAVWEKVEFADTQVRLHGDLALVTGRVDYHQRGKTKITVINLRVLSVWVKGPSGWQMIARQATRPTP